MPATKVSQLDTDIKEHWTETSLTNGQADGKNSSFCPSNLHSFGKFLVPYH